MTDLISKLADDLIALNNASPRLPRKEQIEEVLHTKLRTAEAEFLMHLFPMYSRNEAETAVDAAMMAAFPSYLVSQEQLVKAADDICAATNPTGHHICASFYGDACDCGATKP